MSKMYSKTTTLISAAALCVSGQQIGTLVPETHPSLNVEVCDDASGCTLMQKSVVLDANWRWTHKDGTNCYTGNGWDSTICPDGLTCATDCAVEGADYAGTYGITTDSNELRLNFVTDHDFGRNVGSRVYLLDDEDSYMMFHLKNREFTMSVDNSRLGCGLNGAVYLVSMSEDGGSSEFPTNAAGAAYGTGYCDAQCPRDMKFINGEANVEGWDGTSANSGKGFYGACCAEMDILEANSIAQAYTPHPCSEDGLYKCEQGEECGDGEDRQNGICDKDGCDFASYRLGATSFFGPGNEFTIDTTREYQLTTQFITADGTDDGDLVEIRRYYVQDGIIHANPTVDISEKTFDSLTDNFCDATKATFGDPDTFGRLGGLKQMGDQLAQGMVLVLSLWDDYDSYMLWLDGEQFPVGYDGPGSARGTCPVTSGRPDDVESEQADAYVLFKGLKFGTLNSTITNSNPVIPPPTTDDSSDSENDDSSGEPSTPGVCCWWSANADMCSDCSSFADESNFCASEATCGQCGGTWCSNDPLPVGVPTTAPILSPTAAPIPAPTAAPIPAPTAAEITAPIPAPTATPTMTPTTAPTTSSGIIDEPLICEDSSSWFKKGNTKKGCAWVSKNPEKRCSKKNDDKVRARDACLVSCETCPL